MVILTGLEQNGEVGRLACAITEHRLFAGLPWENIPELVPALRTKEFQDEEISCHCPDALHDGFLVLEGRVAITHRLRGLEHVLELAGFGTVFNLEGLLGIEESHRAARALGKIRLLVMDTELLKRQFGSHPEIGYPIIKNFAKLMVVQHDKVFEHWVM